MPQMKNLSSISDIPLHQSTNDFGTEQYVQGLVQFITHSAAPITIALQGEWGSGKTSLMNRLYNDLCSDGKDFVGININTWEYSMLATPEETVVKIIAQLVRELSGSDPKSQNKTSKIFKAIANFGYRAGREFMKGIVPGAGVIVEGIGMAPNLGEGTEESHRVTLSDLKEALTLSIKESIGTDKKGIVVFVDDLDRLNPPLAVQILELLKNIFTLEHCIFVLAIDYDVVVKGLEPKFGTLNPNNEREFRSYFDKIIQVPFHLPVNNYRPMDFVLDSLESIGYITHVERNLPRVQSIIEKMVVSSVGKNPRSIKRLINTLSLNECIARCCRAKDENDSLEVKFINFAFVALQVCFPKIYNILSNNPIFEKWDNNVASKCNPSTETEDLNKDEKDIILDAIQSDSYLKKNQDNVIALLDIISESVPTNVDKEKYLKEILKRSASTNIVPTTDNFVELDRKTFIDTLHNNIRDYIQSKHPEIQFHSKRNTGNGGYYIHMPDDSYFQVVFQPCQVEGKIALKIVLHVWNKRPDRLLEKPYSEVITDAKVLEAIKPLDELVRNLCHYGLIESKTFEEKFKFDNLVDEFKFREGELWEAFSGNVEYWIKQQSPSDFEDKAIIETIGKLIIAAYELNKNAKDLS